jgi:hypothetical protein
MSTIDPGAAAVAVRRIADLPGPAGSAIDLIGNSLQVDRERLQAPPRPRG